MRNRYLALLLALLSSQIAADDDWHFETPVRLSAAGEFIEVPSPGYACPTVADVDGDGSDDLVVGQFREGAMRFYRNSSPPGETPVLEAGVWLTVEGKMAQVPGVW